MASNRSFFRNALTKKIRPFIQSVFRDRSFITSRGSVGGWGGGGQGNNFLRGLILGVTFENAQNVRGVEILRHRTGLLCKSCQTIL